MFINYIGYNVDHKHKLFGHSVYLILHDEMRLTLLVNFALE